LAVISLGCKAQDILLPQPQKTGGKPLMEALSDRQSTRDYSDKELDEQTLSNLLWATYGFNRESKRTAPSANDRQEFVIYVVLKSGVYVYDAQKNILIEKVKGDFRAKTGKQGFVATAPVNLVFVADLSKNDVGGASSDAGFISQNVYLFCASANLGTVVRGWFDKNEVKTALKLGEKEEPILVQTVGYKK
jgi:SagB-type dehydrogenase family enzyme